MFMLATTKYLVLMTDFFEETAFDPEHPYYDEKSNRDNPKWCLVHVEFRQKFPEIIKLKELQKYAKDGGILEHMQTLKQSRLSVSRVTKKEWDFIMGLVDMEDVAAASAQHQPNMLGWSSFIHRIAVYQIRFRLSSIARRRNWRQAMGIL